MDLPETSCAIGALMKHENGKMKIHKKKFQQWPHLGMYEVELVKGELVDGCDEW